MFCNSSRLGRLSRSGKGAKERNGVVLKHRVTADGHIHISEGGSSAVIPECVGWLSPARVCAQL